MKMSIPRFVPIWVTLISAAFSLVACGSKPASEESASHAVMNTIALDEKTHIVVKADEAAPIHRAITDLVRDFRVVSGFAPQVVSDMASVPEGAPVLIVAGPAWGNSSPVLTDRLEGTESHALYTRNWENRDVILLHGYDMRGTLYAIYTFSEKILGVPPLWFWASWTPESLLSPEVPGDLDIRFGIPSVPYRVWFPNDQRLIGQWVSRNSENRRYVFETMLRLKLNTVDILSHLDGSHQPLYRLHTDADWAQQYGIAITMTHTAPLGAHPAQARWDNFWRNVKGVQNPPQRSIYDPDSLIEYWSHHIRAGKHHNLELIWPIAFRGGGDVAFWQRNNFEDPGDDVSRGRVIREMIDRQIDLIKTITGDNEPLMRITLYNEKSDFLAEGYLELPEEPNLIYTFVAARRDHFPPLDLLTFEFEDHHLTGYYFNFQFTSTGSHVVQAESPAKMEKNFRTVHELSPSGLKLGKVNAGNIREHVMELNAHAEMMWDIDNYDSDRFLRSFATTYFGEEFSEEISQLVLDFYNAYWEQKPPTLEDFSRQFIFQDLRLQRAVFTLAGELAKNNVDLNPFMGGDWFRIRPEAHGVDSEVEAVIVGMSRSVSELDALTTRANDIMKRLPDRHQTFFNDNFLVQIELLRELSATVLKLAEAVIAHDRGNSDERMNLIRQSAEHAQAMEEILLQAEGGVFDRWYEPTRNSNQSSMFRIWQMRRDINRLF